MPDRFFNGDATNDRLGVAECFDPSNARRFHGGDVRGLTAKLSYLNDLGITTLWSTPFYKQIGVRGDACGYHGYWADFAFPDDTTMEPKLGTPSDVDALLADLHGRGMRFVLDVVVNHAGYGARVVGQKPGWFHTYPACQSLGDPEVYCPLGALPDFAQEMPEVAAYVTGVTSAWLTRFAIDGIRMDTAKHVPLDYYRTSFFPAIATHAALFSVAEVLDEGAYSKQKPFLDVGFTSTFNFPLRRALVDCFAKGGSVDLVANRVRDEIDAFGLENALNETNLLDNHDVNRFMTEAGALSNTELGARYALGLTALVTLPGIPQLYAGDELGALGAANGTDDHRRDMPSWAWDAAMRPATAAGFAGSPRANFDLTRKLLSLRAATPALTEGSYAELWRANGANANVLAFLRARGDSRVIVVLSNASAPTGVIQLPIRGYTKIPQADRDALGEGTLLDDVLGSGGEALLTVKNGAVQVSPTGKTAAIYVPRKMK